MLGSTSCSRWLWSLMWARPLNRLTFTKLRATRITRTCTQSMHGPTGNCLHWHVQPLPDRVFHTYMFQTDHDSPSAGSIHVSSHEVLWKTDHCSHQHHHSGNARPTPICIPPQLIHRWCNLNCTPHCPYPPGQKEHLCENAVHWPQLSIQHI